jgi:hypothetical protein
MHRLVLAALCILVGDAAWAQESFPRNEFFGKVGGSFYTGNRGLAMGHVFPPGGGIQLVPMIVRAEFSKSFRLVGGYRYWFKEKEAVEFTFSFSANRIELHTPNLPANLSETWQTDMRNIAVNYVRRLPRWKRLEPFATGGAGIGIFLKSSEGAEVKFVVNFGLGADIQLSPRWLFRMEVRDFLSAQPSEGSPAQFRRTPQGVTHGIVPTAGFVFRF